MLTARTDGPIPPRLRLIMLTVADRDRQARESYSRSGASLSSWHIIPLLLAKCVTIFLCVTYGLSRQCSLEADLGGAEE